MRTAIKQAIKTNVIDRRNFGLTKIRPLAEKSLGQIITQLLRVPRQPLLNQLHHEGICKALQGVIQHDLTRVLSRAT